MMGRVVGGWGKENGGGSVETRKRRRGGGVLLPIFPFKNKRLPRNFRHQRCLGNVTTPSSPLLSARHVKPRRYPLNAAGLKTSDKHLLAIRQERTRPWKNSYVVVKDKTDLHSKSVSNSTVSVGAANFLHRHTNAANCELQVVRAGKRWLM